jgi:hypothetical protein
MQSGQVAAGISVVSKPNIATKVFLQDKNMPGSRSYHARRWRGAREAQPICCQI